MLVKDIIDQLELWAPVEYAESYDNVGLLTGDFRQSVTGVLINLDMIESVIDEAIARDCNLVIAHHPIWFRSKKRLIAEDYVSKTLIKAIQHNIALYAFHTNLDNVRDGVNRKLADKLALQHTQLLAPKPDQPEIGAGMIGYLPQPTEPMRWLHQIKDRFQAGGIRYADCPLTQIHKVAVCGGAGSFLIKRALAAHADAMITADITYHTFFDNENKMWLIDIGHYESEQFTSELIADYLSKIFPKFAIHLSDIYTNPVKYL